MNSKSIFLIFLIGCGALLATPARGQSNVDAREVLDRYYRALGGQSAISALSDLRLTGLFTARGCKDKSWTIHGRFEELRSVEPYRLSAFYYADTLLAVGTLHGQGFVHQPGLSDFVFIEGVRTSDIAPVPFTNPDTVESAHILDGKGLYEVILRDAGDTRWQVYFDSETALPVRAKKTLRIALLGRDCKITLRYSNFREIRGVKLPHRIEKSACDLGTVTYTVDQYRVPDQPFDRELFRVSRFEKLLVMPEGAPDLTRSPERGADSTYQGVTYLSEEGKQAYDQLARRKNRDRISQREAQRENQGTSFPAFSLPTSADTMVTDGYLSGKVTIVDFWATWCGSCVRAMPKLAAFADSVSGDSFQLLSISLDTDKEAYRDFLATHPEFDWPHALDISSLFGKLDGFAVPTYFLVNRKGVIEEVYLGMQPRMLEKTRRMINEH